VARWIPNGHSKEAPTNSMIFKISFENQATLARDSPKSKYQSKQISSRTFMKHDFGLFRCLPLFKLEGSNVIKKIICLVVNIYSSWQTDPQYYWSIFILFWYLFVQYFMNARKATRGIECPIFEHASLSNLPFNVPEIRYRWVRIFDFTRGLKGTVARDFRPSVFFINQPHLGPWCMG
jgi:hypothetical protein